MVGLIPAMTIIEVRPPPKRVETPCPHYRDRRDKLDHDVCWCVDLIGKCSNGLAIPTFGHRMQARSRGSDQPPAQ
jgi:hypothetical protein